MTLWRNLLHTAIKICNNKESSRPHIEMGGPVYVDVTVLCMWRATDNTGCQGGARRETRANQGTIEAPELGCVEPVEAQQRALRVHNQEDPRSTIDNDNQGIISRIDCRGTSST